MNIYRKQLSFVFTLTAALIFTLAGGFFSSFALADDGKESQGNKESQRLC